MPGSTKNHEEEKQWNFRRCKEYGLGNLRDPVLMTIHLYGKVRIGFRARCWETVQYKIPTKIRRLKGSNAVSLQPPWPTTAAAQHPTHPKDNVTLYAIFDQQDRHHFAVVRLQQQLAYQKSCCLPRILCMHVHNTREDGFFFFVQHLILESH